MPDDRPPSDPDATVPDPPRDPDATLPDRADRTSQLGRYDVTGRLGASGMGEVLAAFDPALRRRVAPKRATGGGSVLARVLEALALALAGLAVGGERPARWGVNSHWWRQVARELRRNGARGGPGDDAAEPRTAAQLNQRDVARESRGDLDGAIWKPRSQGQAGSLSVAGWRQCLTMKS